VVNEELRHKELSQMLECFSKKIYLRMVKV